MGDGIDDKKNNQEKPLVNANNVWEDISNKKRDQSEPPEYYDSYDSVAEYGSVYHPKDDFHEKNPQLNNQENPSRLLEEDDVEVVISNTLDNFIKYCILDLREDSSQQALISSLEQFQKGGDFAKKSRSCLHI